MAKKKEESLLGKLVIKIAGRDAGQVGVVVEEKDGFVIIDGSVRRRKCNPKHLEILPQKVDVKSGATHADVVSALKTLGISVVERKPKEKKAPKEEKKEEKPKKAKKEKK